jgi:hypothetical protein
VKFSDDYSYVKGGRGGYDYDNSKLGFASSWLEPSGEFHSIAGQKSHENWAIKHGYSIRELFEKGWMRVLFIGDIIYATNDFDVPVNRSQINNLVDAAIMSRRFNEVVYEGSSRDRSIWRKDED